MPVGIPNAANWWKFNGNPSTKYSPEISWMFSFLIGDLCFVLVYIKDHQIDMFFCKLHILDVDQNWKNNDKAIMD